VSRPQTVEGHEVWDLAMKLGKTTPLKTGGVILHYLPQAAG